ncbi:LacI family DNA-binding transcriptional regulator [Zafaria sp. Z1313]|uniref:LacI family DNA-binding transcriptional regulator n=1 Tax=unclassified Zafaria TaxID=2828765 RepID=UPI002E76FAFD|nr:LacI family DNA-binding transcriptional regulator [Zafaria sp. J156]MEE1620082.1 LacI family DNA-binding transcriptional regulator [Zafaria sp. J156]
MKARRPTALDVAKLAGVSRSAVSMVLNGHADGNVAPEAQSRIRAAAAELDYTPHPVAVSLRNQRSLTLGIVTDEIVSSPFAGKVVSGASSAAAERGYLVVVADSDRHPEREQELIAELVRRRMDGIIYATGALRTLDVPSGLLSQPAALANCRDAQGRLPGVVPAEVEGGQAAAAHLISLGHRRLAMAAGDDNDAGPERVVGYRRAVSAAGLPEGTVLEAGWEVDDGYAAAARLLGGSPEERPTGIVCANDRVAVGVMLYAARHGISVPDELSVIGYDDQQHLAAHLVPSLTTVALPHAEMGAAAAGLLLDALEGRPAAGPRGGAGAGAPLIRVPCPLVVRASTAPPRT